MGKKIVKFLICLFVLFMVFGCTLRASISSLNFTSSKVSSSDEIIPDEASTLIVEEIGFDDVTLSWSSPSSEVSYSLSLVPGSVAPLDCSSGIFVVGDRYNVTGLLTDTQYSFRLCVKVSDGTVMSRGSTGQFKTYKQVVRQAVYPSFRNWNDYLMNDGSSVLNANGVACSMAATGTYFSCLNGGHYSKANLSNGETCDGISVEDELDVFVWHCNDSGPVPFVYSSGIKYERGLQHLISEQGFKQNRIKVLKNGVLTSISRNSVWWDNPVEELPVASANSVVSITNGTSTSGKVYYVKDNRIGGRYVIDSDKISIVALPGAKLSLASGADPLLTGGSIFTGVRYFLWIEGEYDGKDQAVFSTMGLSFSRFNLIKFKTTASAALQMSSAMRTYISHFRLFGGIEETNGFRTIIHSGLISGGPQSLTTYSSSYGNILSGVTFSNSGSSSVNSSTVGYLPDFSSVQNISIINTRDDHAFHLYDSSNTDQSLLVHSLLVANSGSLYQNRGGGVTYSQIVVGLPASSVDRVIDFSNINGADNSFTNNLVLSHLNCSVVGNARDPGVSDATCNPTISSSAQLTVGFDLTKVFVGKIIQDDSQNLSDILGLQLFDHILDWLSFSNKYRTWGRDAGAFPDSTNVGSCYSGQNCRIWDYRLKADADNLAFNRSDILTVSNGLFVPGAACPTAISGNKTTDFVNNTVLNRFLTNAQEIFDDGIGDEDGLCESDEACLYTPNIGAYQGEGEFYSRGTCVFANGAVTGVKMYAYPTNGIN